MRVLLLTHSSFHRQHSTRMKPHPTGVEQLGLQAHTAERSSGSLMGWSGWNRRQGLLGYLEILEYSVLWEDFIRDLHRNL